MAVAQTNVPAAANPAPSRTPRAARTTSTNAVGAVIASARASGADDSKDLAGEIMKMRFERTPDALLQAVKAQQAGGAITEGERFRMAVLLGDWAAAGKTLKSLPQSDARRAYKRLLESLSGNSQSAAQFYQQATPPSSSGASSGMSAGSGSGGESEFSSRRGLFLADDFYAVVAASPTDLDAADLPQIAALAKIAIGPDGRQAFLARLQKGLQGYGGATPEGRKLAAQLLSSLDWITDAASYLPLQREEWGKADTLSLLLALEYYTQTGIQSHDERTLKKAAELCAFLMQASRLDANDRSLFRQATDRFVKLLPALDRDEAGQLIRANFLTQPAILNDLILVLGEAGQRAQQSSDVNLRGQSLAAQASLLRVLADSRSALPEGVNVLVMNWLTEAEATYRSGVVKGADEDSENMSVSRPLSYYQRRNQQTRVVTPDMLLASAPTPALIKGLNQGLAQRVNLTLLKVNLMDPREPITLDALAAYLKQYPGQERALCEDYLAAWVKKRGAPPEDPNITRVRSLGYSVSRPQPPPGGIPLTRLRQNQNVAEYKDLIGALRKLSPEPISPGAVVQGFMAIHSGAEVYRAEEVDAIFGPPEKMNHAELMQLLAGMRTKLRTQWQDPSVQTEAGTNRSEQETKDEVSRGYKTALDLLKRGLPEAQADWKEMILRGQLFFDAAEYEYSRQVKLSDYVSLRDEAFNSYRKAAQIYAARVPQLARGQWTIEPYQAWFAVMLGASDLSQLSHVAVRSDPGLTQIGDAMRALPGDAADGHLQKFGEMLGNQLPRIIPNMRLQFLTAGLKVVGEQHPGARAAQASLRNYQEMLDELQLRVIVDGPTRVGHGQPFGFILSLEHTRQIGRESGGFGKYVQNAPPQRTPSHSAAAAGNHRDDLARNIHAALDGTFEVSAITFHDANVIAVDLPREGWQETPLAYCVARAKEAAVDRIPSIQLDMDFNDTSGQVVLPVRSQVQPIDAKEGNAGPRPCPGLALTFTMDEREWAREGKAVVEVSAKAHGVIPAHPELFDFAREGFDVDVVENGVSVGEFISDGKTKQANADRGWQFTYKRKKDLRGDVTLKFPTVKAGIPVASTEYQHYQDADLVKLDAKQAATGITFKTATGRSLRGAVIALLVIIAGIGVWLFQRARSRRPKAVEAGLALPAQITPFTVVAFLRRLQKESAGKLDDTARQSLRTQIGEIEAAFFRGGPAPANAPDLESIAQKWWQAAR